MLVIVHWKKDLLPSPGGWDCTMRVCRGPVRPASVLKGLRLCEQNVVGCLLGFAWPACAACGCAMFGTFPFLRVETRGVYHQRTLCLFLLWL